MSKALVIGASSGIARALISELEGQDKQVFSVSRNELARPRHWVMDYSDLAVTKWCDDISAQGHQFEYVYICNGMLHGDQVSPEKSLNAFDQSAFFQVMQCNTVTPMWWLSNVSKLLAKKSHNVITVFSARVGSISDNKLGGWYSYRASKAALNMLTKTAAIELRRTHKQSKVLLFHPGTTDTKLSKPFQKNVPSEKLFSPEYVAKRLYQLSCEKDDLPPFGYFDWDHKTIEF